MIKAIPKLVTGLVIVIVVIVAVNAFVASPKQAVDALVGVADWVGARAGDIGGFFSDCWECISGGCKAA